jgi:phenylacetate 2-hydroxylase
MAYLIVASAVLLASYILSQLLFKTDTPKIKGLPEIPGWPIVGNLLQLGSDHAAVCMKWAEKYGPVFQVRFVFLVALSRCQDGLQKSRHRQHI